MEIKEILLYLDDLTYETQEQQFQRNLVKAQIQAMAQIGIQLERIADAVEELNEMGINVWTEKK